MYLGIGRYSIRAAVFSGKLHVEAREGKSKRSETLQANGGREAGSLSGRVVGEARFVKSAGWSAS